MFVLRPAMPTDLPAIAAVHEAAFPTPDEARLVRLLLERGQDYVSLVATSEGDTVGHVLFSPAMLESQGRVTATGLGLAPLAVVPEFQQRGIGSALVRAGLDQCRQLNTTFVIVLGEPAYYSRFGFLPASHYGLTGEFGGGDAFQIQWLAAPTHAASGFARYAPAFSELFGTSTTEPA